MKQKCIKVLKKKGEPVRRILIELDLLDLDVKIASDTRYLFLPLLREPALSELAKIPEEFELSDFEFELLEKKPKPEDLLGFTPSYEIIGDIALLEDSDHSAAESKKIADAILATMPHIKTVLKALTPVIGEFRVREFEVVAGEPKTETVHKEYGCRYKVDLAKAYFTPRLSTERSRVLSGIKEGDTVVDMFAGVGPYSVLIAKRGKPAKVIAIDKNPEAVRYLRANVALNAVKNLVAIEGDAREEAVRFAGIADHVIMNLPHNAYEFLDSAVLLVKPGGVLHYYGITPEEDLYDSSLELIREAAKKAGRGIEVLETRAVRSYAPHQYNICIEVRVF